MHVCLCIDSDESNSEDEGNCILLFYTFKTFTGGMSSIDECDEEEDVVHRAEVLTVYSSDESSIDDERPAFQGIELCLPIDIICIPQLHTYS